VREWNASPFQPGWRATRPASAADPTAIRTLSKARFAAKHNRRLSIQKVKNEMKRICTEKVDPQSAHARPSERSCRPVILPPHSRSPARRIETLERFDVPSGANPDSGRLHPRHRTAPRHDRASYLHSAVVLRVMRHKTPRIVKAAAHLAFESDSQLAQLDVAIFRDWKLSSFLWCARSQLSGGRRTFSSIAPPHLRSSFSSLTATRPSNASPIAASASADST
jgi:hypothetical protein